MFNSLLSTMAPVFICIVIGYVWQYRGLKYDQQFVTRLVMNVGAPCLIVSAMANTQISVDQFADIAIATVVIAVLCALLAIPFALRSSADPMAIIAPAAIPNTGNMGLSICLFAFGKTGLALGIAYFITSTFLNMALAIPLFARDGGGFPSALKTLVKQPLMYGTVIGLIIVIFNLKLPVWIANTTQLLGDITIPLMLITLGVSLGSIKNSGWLISSGYSLLRLGGGGIFALLVTSLMGITGLTQKIIILQSVMPAAVFNYLFAVHYQRSPEMTAGIVVTSTAMSFVILPILLFFML